MLWYVDTVERKKERKTIACFTTYSGMLTCRKKKRKKSDYRQRGFRSKSQVLKAAKGPSQNKLIACKLNHPPFSGHTLLGTIFPCLSHPRARLQTKVCWGFRLTSYTTLSPSLSQKPLKILWPPLPQPCSVFFLPTTNMFPWVCHNSISGPVKVMILLSWPSAVSSSHHIWLTMA